MSSASRAKSSRQARSSWSSSPSSSPSLSSSQSPSSSSSSSQASGPFPSTPTSPVVTVPEPPVYNATELSYPADASTLTLPAPENPDTYHDGIQDSAWDLNYSYSHEQVQFDTFPNMTYPAYEAGPALEGASSNFTTFDETTGEMYDMGGFNSDGYFTYTAQNWGNYQLDPFTNGSDLGNYFPSMELDVSVETDFVHAPPAADLSSLAQPSEVDPALAAMGELFMATTTYPSIISF
ncbi:hypothetical protein D9758_006482 [Tetrapyrgos nigripes]|uniref:Uncharacterized protein n=1 Tax=Tetrapyrgos nigripes TaxID=182062 RepID=A0A8H5GKM9_9AGAR|nr:hypothetical protein D9758_006482 [Tetrapyrgos nigripes]